MTSSLPNRVSRFGKVLFDRATGAADEMESAKSVCALLAGIYEPRMRVLDVGCGAGHYLRSLRQRIDPEIDYSGVDLTGHYIELARQAFPDVNTFAVGDARKLEFDDDSFDVVLCMNVIPNLPPPPTSAIAELLRVSSRYVVIRSLFADMTYLIRELLSEDGEDSSLIAADGSVPQDRYLHNNMYSEDYFRSVIREIDSSVEIGIESDESTVPIDNRTEHGAWGTRTDGGLQIAGQLVLDWRFATLSKHGDPTT